MTTGHASAWPPPSPALSRMLFGALPVLAALGPLLTVFRGLYAFRIACVLVVGYALVFLLGRSRWRAPDVWLAATTTSIAGAGLLGLGAIAPGSDDPYSELLSSCSGSVLRLPVDPGSDRCRGCPWHSPGAGWSPACSPA